MTDTDVDVAGTTTDDAAPAEAPASISEGQALLEQLKATLTRLIQIRDRLDKVMGSIRTPRQTTARGDLVVNSSTDGTIFFDLLRKLTAATDGVAGDLEKRVADLEGLF